MTTTTDTMLQQYQNCPPPPVVQNVLAYGAETFVPNHDVCRLSYYLKCCTIGCGIDLFLNLPEFIDYQVAHLLPLSIQNTIIRLAFEEFNLDLLMNRALILDEEHILLPEGTLNTFYKFEMASTFFAALDRFAIVAGHRLEIHKVMLCTGKWIREYYMNPLLRYLQQQQHQYQHQQPPAGTTTTSTTTPSSTTQADARILSDDEESQSTSSSSSSSTSMDVACVPAQILQSPSSAPAPASCRRQQQHHHHPPTATTTTTECTVAVATEVNRITRRCSIMISPRTTSCAVCHRPPHQIFGGAWYRCMGCINDDFCLCESCYRVGEHHDQTHEFVQFRFDGSNPEPIGSQIQALARSSRENDCSALLPDFPLAIAVPLQSSSSYNNNNNHNNKY